LTNKSFCPGAFDAFVLMIKNIGRFAIAGGIGRVYMFFGTILISAFTCSFGFILLTTVDSVGITSPIPALVVLVIISAGIADQFLSVYSFSTDAILQSFLLDEELKFKGHSRPKSMEDYA